MPISARSRPRDRRFCVSETWALAMARVLVPLPARDFDPSEAAVGWRVLVNAGHTVGFATPDGRPAVADDMMLTGEGLDPWGAIPLLRNLPPRRTFDAGKSRRAQSLRRNDRRSELRRATAMGCHRRICVRRAAV